MYPKTIEKLASAPIIVFFPSYDVQDIDMHEHTYTHKYTQSHTHTHTHTRTRTRTQTQTYAWEVPATSRTTSYNDLRPTEPTRVNVSLTEKLN